MAGFSVLWRAVKMRFLQALAMIAGLVAPASAATGYALGPSISTTTGKLTQGIAGTYQLAASSLTLSTPTIVLDGGAGGVNASSITVLYGVIASSFNFKLITSTFSVRFASVSVYGAILATGNITGNQFIGNGSMLTGIISSGSVVKIGDAASGVLGGTYPNPTFGSQVVLSSHVANSAIGDAQANLSTAAIKTGKFGDTFVLITTGAFTGGFNGNSQFVQLNGTGQLPGIDGSNLLNITATSLSTSAVAPTPGTLIQTINTNGGALPRGICWDGSQAWVMMPSSNTVQIFNSTGIYLTSINVSSGPYACANDGLGSMWITQFSTNSVAKVSMVGPNYNTTYYTILQHAPVDITADMAGNVYTVSQASASFLAITSTGGISGMNTAALLNPNGITYAGWGLAVSDINLGSVVVFSTGAAKLCQATLAIGGARFKPGFDGVNVWSNEFSAGIARVSSACAFTEFGGSRGGTSTGGNPIFDGSRMIHFGATNGINFYSLEGAVSTVTFSPALSNGNTWGAYDGNNSLWVTNNLDVKIYRYATSGTDRGLIAAQPYSFATWARGIRGPVSNSAATAGFALCYTYAFTGGPKVEGHCITTPTNGACTCVSP